MLEKCEIDIMDISLVRQSYETHNKQLIQQLAQKVTKDHNLYNHRIEKPLSTQQIDYIFNNLEKTKFELTRQLN